MATATTQRYMHLSPAAIESAIRLLGQRVSRHGREKLMGPVDHRSVTEPQPARPSLRNPLRAPTFDVVASAGSAAHRGLVDLRRVVDAIGAEG